jgi:hypothetical protein
VPRTTPPAGSNRGIISVFLLWNLAGMVFWAQPYTYQPRTLIYEVTGGYMRFLGLWQHWDMFSPGPRTIRVRMDATVTLRDGSEKIWTFPQMESMSLFERLRKERYRKWAYDAVRTDREQALRHPTAIYIARQFQNSRNPPVKVRLHRYWRAIPPPSEHAINENNMPEFHFTFYETRVEPILD